MPTGCCTFFKTQQNRSLFCWYLFLTLTLFCWNLPGNEVSYSRLHLSPSPIFSLFNFFFGHRNTILQQPFLHFRCSKSLFFGGFIWLFSWCEFKIWSQNALFQLTWKFILNKYFPFFASKYLNYNAPVVLSSTPISTHFGFQKNFDINFSVFHFFCWFLNKTFGFRENTNTFLLTILFHFFVFYGIFSNFFGQFCHYNFSFPPFKMDLLLHFDRLQNAVFFFD